MDKEKLLKEIIKKLPPIETESSNLIIIEHTYPIFPKKVDGIGREEGIYK